MRHRDRLVSLGVLTFFIALVSMALWLVSIRGGFDTESSYLLRVVLSGLVAGALSVLFSLWIRHSRTITEADEPRAVRLCALVFIEAVIVLTAAGQIGESATTAPLNKAVRFAAMFLVLQVAAVISLASHRWIGLSVPTVRQLIEDLRWVRSRAPRSAPER